MEFVAIDFETANSRADSACQLAVVQVREGAVVDEHCWLVRPPSLHFSSRNIAIHGIRPAHVARADSMAEIWPSLQPLLEGQVVVAHNARFDMGVLVASLAAHDIACPVLDFSCTRAIARRAWPGQPRYGLKPLGTWLGIDFKHHDALEDARCCALLALAAATQCGAGDFAALERALRLTRGRYGFGRINGPRTIGGNAPRGGSNTRSVRESGPAYPGRNTARGTTTRRGDVSRSAMVAAAGDALPLNGKHIVFLGGLRGMTYEQTVELAEQLGAQCTATIAGDTDYVVACGGVLLAEAAQLLAAHRAALSSGDTTEDKLTTEDSQSDRRSDDINDDINGDIKNRADAASHRGQRVIRVLSERQFLALMPGGKASVQW
jgi:DNA polymerase III subunit epsilon